MTGATSHDLAAERAILGALLRNARRVLELVEPPEPRSYFHPAHVLVATAIGELVAASKPVDMLTVADQLGARLPAAGGLVELSELEAGYLTADNVAHYVGIIRDHALKRRVCIAASEVLAVCDNEHDSGEDAHGELLRQAAGVEGPEQQDRAATLAEVVGETVARVTGGVATRRSVLTGYAEVDDMTGGLARGVVTILAGRPSQGKSALARSFALNAARAGEGVHVFSLEDARDRYGDRMLADLADVDLGKFSARNASFDDEERWKMRRACEQVASLPLLIDDAAGLSSQQIANRVRQRSRQLKTSLVVVDYVQLMRERGTRDKREEVDRAAEGMVRLAREHDVAVLLLSQLSRESERRDDKRPLLSDLRESGTLEQAAYAVFMVHQEWLYLSADSKHAEVQAAYRKAFGVADLLVRKNKNGQRGDLKLRWDARRATYVEPRLADRY